MKWMHIGLASCFFLGASFAASWIHPWGDPRTSDPPGAAILGASSAPEKVRGIFEAKCADCHSNSPRRPVYSRFAPASWLIERDIQEARTAMNLSNWPEYGPENQAGLLARIASEVRNNRMPLERYLLLHPTARLTDADRQTIVTWAHDERKRLRVQIEKTPQETTK
jgi:cytochrome c